MEKMCIYTSSKHIVNVTLNLTRINMIRLEKEVNK